MRRASFLAVAAAAFACSGPGREAPRDDDVLRVSTHWGLVPVTPQVVSTFTRSLLALVYHPLRHDFDAVEKSGNSVRLARSPASPSTPAQLAAKIVRDPSISSVEVDGDGVTVRFRGAAEASRVTLESPLLDAGNFVQDRFATDELVLRRLGSGHGPQRIAAHNVPSEEEEWRRLLAHDVDLIPLIAGERVEQLRRLPSIRVVPVAEPQTVALWLNPARPYLADTRVRRAIAATIRRGPLAATVMGDARLAVAVDEDPAAAERWLRDANVALPLRLDVVVIQTQTDMQRAALVLGEQLAPLGIELKVDVMSLAEFDPLRLRRDFDAIIFWGGWSGRYARILEPMVGYRSADLDAAVAAHDETRLREVLARDVPLTPLYRINEAVAVDVGWCGVHPHDSGNIDLWLGDVHRCAPGEHD